MTNTQTHSENVYLHKNGEILDEKSKAQTETNTYSSSVEENWRPVEDLSTEAGKSLRDRLKSTDSANISDKVIQRLASVRASQDSLDKSVDSVDLGGDNVFSGKSYEGSSVSISSERSGSRSPHLTYKDGVIVSGTLEELTQELLPRAHSCPPDSFMFSFLLSSRLYLTPWHLLGETFRRADQLAHMISTTSYPAYVSNLLRLLSNWITWFPYDFQEEATMVKLRKLTGLCVSCDGSVSSRVTQLMQSLLKHLTAVEKHTQYVAKLRKLQCESEGLTPLDIVNMSWQPSVIAQQLTHLELQYLSFIGPDEFVNAFARDCSKSRSSDSNHSSNGDSSVSEARLRAGKKTSNLEAYISWFNRLSYLIASSVCRHKRKKHGARAIEFWIEVARECVNIGNFNSMMGIISGLNMTPISRLKRTWAKIQSGKFTVLGHQMDPSSNFVSYRTTLQVRLANCYNFTTKNYFTILCYIIFYNFKLLKIILQLLMQNYFFRQLCLGQRMQQTRSKEL